MQTLPRRPVTSFMFKFSAHSERQAEMPVCFLHSGKTRQSNVQIVARLNKLCPDNIVITTEFS